MNKYLLAMCGMLVAGCTHVNNVRAPNGDNWIGIEAHGKLDCYIAAGKECPNGYDVVQDISDNDIIIKCHGKSRADTEIESHNIATCGNALGGCPDGDYHQQ